MSNSNTPLHELGDKIHKAKDKINPPTDPNKDPSMLKETFGLMRIGVELVAAVIVGMGVGIYLDKKFDTAPFWLIFCLLFGIAGGVANSYRIISTQTSHKDKAKK